MDYLDWHSELSLETVFAGSAFYSYPTFLNAQVDDQRFVSLSKNASDNRQVLMLHSGEHIRCITPPPFKLQTKVNEYGGKPFWLLDNALVFANQSDQCLYTQSIGAEEFGSIQRLTVKPSEDGRFMYTDVHKLGERCYLSIVEHEQAHIAHDQNLMGIALLLPNGDYLQPSIKVKGADFYSNLVIGPIKREGKQSKAQIAWVQWRHPNMPWDSNELCIADIIIDGANTQIANQRRVSWSGSENNVSTCQLMFGGSGKLFFSADYGGQKNGAADDFWNVHVYDSEADTVSKISQDQCEYGYPHWVYGDKRIVQLTESQIAVIASKPSGDELMLIDELTLSYQSIAELPQADPLPIHAAGVNSAPATIQHLDSDGGGHIIFERLAFDKSPSIVSLALDDNDGASETIKVEPQPSSRLSIEGAEFDISDAEAILYPCRDGGEAHGFYYAPSNHGELAKTSSVAKPPLLVMVHGGPTARAYGHFDLQKQFWTSRGFAILDVNHRGSSGYGRAYRDALYGEWGELDASDIADGVLALIEQGRVDPERICIRGKSAGGYAVLRALTEYPDLFRVGACYYGIGNLVTLAESTHKFEKHYTDRLIDEVFDETRAETTSSHFYQRSPIHKMNQLKSAMIVFQGGLDRVVPPAVSEEVIKVLKEANIDHEYVEYPDEAHGFKLPSNNIDAWQKELSFYRRILSAS